MGCGDKLKKQNWHNDPASVSPTPDPKGDNCYIYIMWLAPDRR